MNMIIPPRVMKRPNSRTILARSQPRPAWSGQLTVITVVSPEFFSFSIKTTSSQQGIAIGGFVKNDGCMGFRWNGASCFVFVSLSSCLYMNSLGEMMVFMRERERIVVCGVLSVGPAGVRCPRQRRKWTDIQHVTAYIADSLRLHFFCV